MDRPRVDVKADRKDAKWAEQSAAVKDLQMAVHEAVRWVSMRDNARVQRTVES